MYSWQRRSGSSWIPVSNTNSQSYTTNRNMAVGQYTYRCVVRNGAGAVASNSATVNVYGEYRTEENFGGKKLWRIWRINGNSPKFFLPKFLIAHCSISRITIDLP